MASFGGTARYEIVRELGAGGMGVVYEAIDRERDGRRLALKVLQRHDPESLVRLKREFRALADLRHPNLAALYELSAEASTWFFTLELIEGVDFFSWLRPQAAALREAPTGALDVTVRAASAPAAVVDFERLRATFRQLIAGVSYLHAQGRLHRDLKPSNVLVTREGRVVILDFGLVLELEGVQSISEERGSSIVGTAAYMAPEQAGSGAVGPPADWYAVGVMLFQALTGRVPFDGVAVQVLLEKQRRGAPSPREFDPSIPDDLAEICTMLLKREAAERPSATDLNRVFGAHDKAPTIAVPRPEGELIGRGSELKVLQRALEETRHGEARYVRIVGASGIGKSALIRRFVESLEGVVLQGRCYERESVPFKALDSVIDALARHLSTLPSEKIDAVLPRDAAALTRMFPVLGRVTAFRNAPVREAKEAAALRRRAVQGLRELLGRMGDREPLVLVVDDAQWGDVDSAQVLEEVLRAPDAPAALLIVLARGEDHPLKGLALPAVELALAPLKAEEAEQLARRTIDDPQRVASIARESGGNPFLLQQLAAARGEVRLEDVVRSRLEELPAPARRLLDVVALAGTPISERVAASVAGLEGSDVESVTLLKAARLIRGAHDERVEAWHDRIRETVVGALDAEQVRQLHARLADGLRDSGDVDLVAWHLGAAGLVERAAEANLEGARRAARQLAFERAAVLIERALELMPADDRRRRDVRIELADAWASAGRGSSAASAYERVLAEPGDAPVSAIELRRRAAEQLLRSGHIDAGLAAVHQVLESLNMTLARTPWRALMALAFRRAHIWLRGTNFVERKATELAPQVLQRIDACWSVSMGLSMVDTIRGASFQARQLLLALDAGEPQRVTRALAAEAAFVATGGVRSERRAAALVSQARVLAERQHDAGLLGLIDFCAGLTRFLVGSWRDAAQLTAQAERRFAEAGSMVSWEAANSRLFSVWSLFYLGDIAGLSVRIPALTREAEQRGDRYAVTSLQCGLANVALLAADDAAGARAAVASAMAGWSTKSFHFQHYWAALSETMIDLYTGELGSSLARMETCWRSLDSSQLLRIQNVRVEARSLMARVLLALGRRDEALEQARLLEREHVGWADALAAMIRGLATGDEAELRRALELFDQNEMALFSAVTRLRLGERQGSDVGAANVRAATAWLQAQGVRSPSSLAQTLAPTSGARALGAR